MNTSRVERDLEACTARHLRSIKDLTSIINMLNEENEELKSEIKRLKEENAQHKEYCCCFKNEKLRLDLNNAKDLLKECQNFILSARKSYSLYPNPEKIINRINAAIGDNEIQESEEK